MVIFMKILVDSAKCMDAMNCRLCLEKCPEQVFLMAFPEPRQRGKRQEKATARAVFLSKCSVCKDCVEFCPQDAIQVLM